MSEIMAWLGDIMTVAGVTLLVGLGLTWWTLRWINQRLEVDIQTLGQELQSKFIPLDVELDNGMYFCYNARDSSFVCQGRTALEIRDAFRKRFPNCVAFLHNAAAMPELRQELMELKANETSSSQ